MGPLPVENLLWYMEKSSKKPWVTKNPARYLEEPSQEPALIVYHIDICHGLPWNRDTIMFLLSYILQFISSLEEHREFSDKIMALDEIANYVHDAVKTVEKLRKTHVLETYPKTTHEISTKQEELSEMLISSFLRPEVVRRFFTVPKLHQLPPSDKHLYPNEIVAGFIDFLLQVLYHEANISEDQLQQWALVRKELSFLLALLGDIPFQCTHNDHGIVEKINILLGEFERLANDAGSFVYDAVFPTHQIEASKFRADTTAWFGKVEVFNDMIKEHCFKFSDLPMSVISRSCVIDSFFIVHSLIEDIENLKHHRFNFNHGDGIMEQMKTLHGELTLSRSFIKVLRDNEEKEGLSQIRNLTYEAEYLINSLVTGNIHAWYLNLRLPSVICKIKRACSELQQISDIDSTKHIKAAEGEVSFQTAADTATMVENHFLDFNDDIKQRISNDQSDYMNILEHGYKHLPRNIKPCFLYFAGFPKDYEISQEKLKWLWIAEGFIQKEGNKSLEETAEMYLLDLINRKLLLIAERGLDCPIKNCRIQSVLHDFCVRKANEENFSKLTNGFSVYEKCHRLCLISTSCNYWRPFGLQCRSYRDLRRRNDPSCFQTMALLKVVDQWPEVCGDQGLAFPAQLRYLGVGNLSNNMVANLANLEFIYVSKDVETDWKIIYVPSVVLRMATLRHLVTKPQAEFEDGWCGSMTEKTNLRILSRFWIKGKKDVDILRCCPHLHKLKCIFSDETKFPDLSFLPELESLKMWFFYGLNAKILSSKIKFPLTIKKLSLQACLLPWEMMSILGRLPNLEVLKLGWDAFTGDVWETRDGEFQKLKCLKIYNSVDLRLWISCSEHFPVLECLVLCSCEKLVDIPTGFGNIPTLQRIELTECSRAACLSALRVGKQIQVDIASYNQTKDEFILEHSIPSQQNLTKMLSCMEEYFEARSYERHKKKSPIVDRTDDKMIGEFVLRDVLSYMEEYFPVEESIKKMTTIDQDETTTTDDERMIFVNQKTYSIVVSYAMQFSLTLEKLASSDTFLALRCLADSYDNRKPCIVRYAMRFSSDSENLAFSDTIMGLRSISESYNRRKLLLPGHPRYADEMKKSITEFSDMLITSFIPQVQRLFEVPKIEQLPDKHLNKNEILASFMNFLLQMLFSEVNNNSAEAKQYTRLQEELSFLLAVLGDTPFQPSTHPNLDEQVNNLLAEFEMFASEVGGFLFSCVFPVQPLKVSRFHVKTIDLLEMAKILNAKVKEHCTDFSERHVSAIVRSNVVDSFFIVDSLIEDLQSIIMNGKLGSFTPDDAMKEQMKTLHAELTLSQSFIRVMQDNEIDEQKGLIQVRDLTYEAEYLINSMVAGNIHAWYLNLRLPPIVCKIKLACSGLQQISTAKVIKASDGNLSFPTTGNTATIDDDLFMDFNPDITQTMLNDLTGKPNTSRQVLTIFGMPGIGKTTTANKLYNGKAALNHFDRRAWCVVSGKYNLRALLIQLLLDLANEPDKNRKREQKANSELGEEIHKTLKGWRYLIVLDDVWHPDVLSKLRRYFPDDKNGSRVIITTRNKDVSPSGSTLCELPILSKHQCWNLLEKKVFPTDPCPSNLLAIGKRVAARCSGVPLAVVVIAGILAKLEKEESEWERVEERLETMLLDGESDYRKIMELSYEHLPHNIKPCFLYSASFSDGSEIKTKMLTRLWIAQGFVQKDGNKSPEQIAETYLIDLINRSLVMTAKRRSDRGPKTCRIHDLLHDICIKKADEENFFKSSSLFSNYEKHQHLCLPPSSSISRTPFGLHCRSFRGQVDQSSGFRTMPLMKVVDVVPKEETSDYEPPLFDVPFQLRYLGISITSKLIPKRMVDNLVNLESFHVSGDYGKVFVVPSVILRMAKLRDLCITHEGKFEEDCNNIAETTNLRSISCVVIENMTDGEILRKSPRLQTLKCICKGETKFPDLSSLAELQSLRVQFRNRIGDVEITFLSTLKKLCLSESRLPWEKMSIIGELPKLQVLKLEWRAFQGEEWETNDNQFQELRFLKMHELDLEQWSSESSHFPCLERLEVFLCRNLQEIPSDLGYIQMLQRIEVKGCSKEACLSAIEIEKEQHEFGNQDLQVDIYSDFWTEDKFVRDETEESESMEEEETE